MDKINEFVNILRDFYTRFSEWVNSSPDANVIAWVSTVFFSAFVIYLTKIPQRLYNRFFRKHLSNHEEKIVAKEMNRQAGERISATLNTYIPPAIDLIGREKDVQNIYSLLEENNIVFVRADGGVGKTALAAKIINNIRKDSLTGEKKYEYVAWITSTGNLINDITGLGIPGIREVKTQDDKFALVCTFLEKSTAFLVIDNMDDPPSSNDINKLNTLAGRTKILITTRAKLSIGKCYKLNDLDPESALVLFYNHFLEDKNLIIDQIVKRKDCNFAKKIVHEASYNTLFIELIAKMSYSDHLKLDSLWNELKKNVFGKNSKHVLSTVHGNGRLQDQIQNLYLLSKLTDKQKEIMSFIALFPAETIIFFDVFEWAGFEDDEVDNLGELKKRGWIERVDEGYLIHTMVKGSIEKQRKEDFDEERYGNLIIKLCDTNQYIPKDMVYTKVFERLIVPDTICGLLADKVSIASLLNKMGNVYYDQGNYEKALECNIKALEIRENVLGKEHPDTAMTYNSIAVVYDDQGNYEKALEYHKKALEVREKVLGKEHLDTAMTYGNMANVYDDQGNYEEALRYNDRALKIYRKVLGEEHSDTAMVYNNIGLVYYHKGNITKAMECYDKSLQIRENVLGKEHPQTAIVYYNIANVYVKQGNLEEALNYFEKALGIFIEKLGEDHPKTKTVKKDIEMLKSRK